MLLQRGLGLLFAILWHRNHIERNFEWAHQRFQIRMIADDADHVAVQLAYMMPAQQIDHAMRQARDHDDDAVTFVGVEESPLQALPRQQRRHRGVELLGQLAYRQSQAFEMDAPEEVAVLVIGVLVGGDNIAAERVKVASDFRYESGPVDA